MKKTVILILLIMFSINGVKCGSDDSGAPTAPVSLEKVKNPAFSPDPAVEFVGSVEITLTCETEGAAIRYTTDGTTMPSKTTGTIYTGPFTITSNTTVRAIAYKDGMDDSDVVIANFTRAGSVANPSFNPEDGASFTVSQVVTITSATSGSTVKYTLDNTDPKTSPTAVTGTAGAASVVFTITDTKTIKAYAFKTGKEDSAVITATITKVPCATPVFNPGTGAFRIYNTEQSVTITTATTGATIKYTLDNSDPKTSPTAITAASGTSTVSFNVFGTKTIKAYAFKTGAEDSTVSSCEYIITRVKLPKTGQTTSFRPGDDGDLQRGAAWPNPRFVDNGDGTITDNLTGLMWQRVPLSTTKNWEQAIDYCNNLTLAGYSDWRLPNRKELMSLVNYGQADPAAWLNSQGFSNVQVGYYWSAGTYAYHSHHAWYVHMRYGHIGSIHNTHKNDRYYVVAVRSGQ